MPSASNSRAPSGSPEQDDVTRGTVSFQITRKEHLSLQIRALLDASDEVDLSAEVAEDLFQSLPPGAEGDDCGCPHDDEEGGEDHEHHDHGEEQHAEDEDEDMEDGPEVIAVDGEIVVSSVFRPKNPGGDGESWTKQEVKQILHHLKEKGSRSFVSEYFVKRNIPIPKLLLAFGIELCPELLTKSSQTLMYILQVAMSFQLRKRERLPQYSTPEDAKQLISNAKKILVLTGAGISVSCGIPDFRSRDGLYAKLKERGEYDLDDPQQMFDINYFRENPAVFYSFASQIYPANFKPSISHEFIKKLEDDEQLLRNYTQNIDTLESKAGITKVIQCHGSFATASCLQCRRKVPGSEIEHDVMNQIVPLCSVCNAAPPPVIPVKKPKKKKGKKEWEESDSEDDHSIPSQFPPGIMKPDITFFGEKLDDSFEKALEADRDQVDLLLVIGTSLKVAPVADILSHIPHSVPQILINKTPIRHINPDIVLLGDADDVVRWLTAPATPPRRQSPRGTSKQSPGDKAKSASPGSPSYERVGDTHVSLFKGAEAGKWVEEVKEQYAKELKEAEAKAEAEAAEAAGDVKPEAGLVGSSPIKESMSDKDMRSGSEELAGREKKRRRV